MESDSEIQKLKQQVIDLEASHEAILEREKQIYTESLLEKNRLLDVYRVKVNRYEFAVKEAALFLAKPMEIYDEWLAGKNQDSTKKIVVGGSPDVEPKRSRAVTQSPKDEVRRRESSVPTPAQMAKKQLQQNALLSSQVEEKMESTTIFNISTSTVPSVLKQDDIQVLECVRLALNYLRNTQKAVKSMKTSGVSNPEELKGSEPPKEKENQNPSIATQTDTPLPTLIVASPIEQTSVEKKTREVSIDPDPIDKKNKINSSLPYLSTLPIPSDDEEGDLSSAGVASPKPQSRGSFSRIPAGPCQKCRKYMLDLDRERDKISQLEREISSLNQILDEERESKERLQLSKEILDQELEELTAQLFDQANKMVIEEARMRDELETSNKELKGELGDLTKKFESRDKELKDLKKYINALETVKRKSLSASSPSTPLGSISNIAGRQLQPIPVDGVLFQEFQEFIQKLHASPPTSITILMTNPFLKRCMVEDIEPCLYYTYQYPGSSIKAVSLSSSFKKKILDSCLNLQLEIQPTTKHEPKTKVKCGTCGITRDCEYRISLSSTPGKPIEWIDCCKFCRDRLSSVLDFFRFIYQTQQMAQVPSRQNLTILSLLRQIWNHRRAMAVARIGNCALFEKEVNMQLNSGGDWESSVKIVN